MSQVVWLAFYELVDREEGQPLALRDLRRAARGGAAAGPQLRDSRICLFIQLQNCSFQKGALPRKCLFSFSLLTASGGKQTKRSDQRISANIQPSDGLVCLPPSSVSRLNQKKQFRETASLPSCSSAHHDAFALHSFWAPRLSVAEVQRINAE